MDTHQTHGLSIDVDLRSFRGFLWLLGGFVVTIDGESFYPSMSGFGFHTSTPFTIEHEGRVCRGVVRSTGKIDMQSSMPYELLIEGTQVGVGRLRIQPAWLPILMSFVFIGVIVLALIGLYVVLLSFSYMGDVSTSPVEGTPVSDSRLLFVSFIDSCPSRGRSRWASM